MGRILPTLAHVSAALEPLEFLRSHRTGLRGVFKKKRNKKKEHVDTENLKPTRWSVIDGENILRFDILEVGYKNIHLNKSQSRHGVLDERVWICSSGWNKWTHGKQSRPIIYTSLKTATWNPDASNRAPQVQSSSQAYVLIQKKMTSLQFRASSEKYTLTYFQGRERSRVGAPAHLAKPEKKSPSRKT